MSAFGFDKLSSRWRIRADLVAQTGLRVGAGKNLDAVATNLPLMRDGNGDPYLPGSSLKGALRSGLERVLRGINSKDLHSCDPLSEETACAPAFRVDKGQRVKVSYKFEDLEKLLCPACKLFGSREMAGRIFIRDLRRTFGSPAEVRDGVGIDRDLRTASPGVKYDLEVMPPGTRFALEVLLENTDDLLRSLALVGLDLIDQGEIRLGGMSSRGLGWVKLENVEIEATTPALLLSADPKGRYLKKKWDVELAEARNVLAKLAA